MMSMTTASPFVAAVGATRRLTEVRDNIETAQSVLDTLFEERKHMVVTAAAAGVGNVEISEILGISRTMVWKILDLPRRPKVAAKAPAKAAAKTK